MPASFVVQADGLKGLVADLKKADAAWPTEIRKGFNAALQPVVSNVKSALGGGRRASTVRATSTTKEARIRAGGPRSAAPWTGWYEFGGTVRRDVVFGHRVASFVWRTIPKNPSGNAIYPAATARDDRVVDEMAKVVDDVMRKAGFR